MSFHQETQAKKIFEFKHNANLYHSQEDPYVVLITGAAGNIGYTISFMIGQGRMFGHNRKIILRLLDVPARLNDLKGLNLELEDCGFSIIKDINYTTNQEEAFLGCDFAIMCGSKPRIHGMKRHHLLKENAKIFEEQGKIINKVAKKSLKICVVGNPANTNALILLNNAPSIDPRQITCLTRLDHNRLVNQISLATQIPNELIKNLIIWGNHSATQYPDLDHAYVNEDTKTPLKHFIKDEKWMQNDLLKKLQSRGEEIIECRKMSSVGSAANAICDHVRDWVLGTKEGEIVSMGVYSNGEYDTPKDIIFSFPVTISNGEWKIVEGLKLSSFTKQKLEETSKELMEEKELALRMY